MTGEIRTEMSQPAKSRRYRSLPPVLRYTQIGRRIQAILNDSHDWVGKLTTVVGREWGGNYTPPRDHRSIYINQDRDGADTLVVATLNDGWEIGIGSPTHWDTVRIKPEALKYIGWWAFKNWIADWFGLRTWIYFSSLYKRGNKLNGRTERYKRRKRYVRVSNWEEWSANNPRWLR